MLFVIPLNVTCESYVRPPNVTCHSLLLLYIDSLSIKSVLLFWNSGHQNKIPAFQNCRIPESQSYLLRWLHHLKSFLIRFNLVLHIIWPNHKLRKSFYCDQFLHLRISRKLKVQVLSVWFIAEFQVVSKIFLDLDKILLLTKEYKIWPK